MIRIVNGDIFDSKMQTLVNPVNMVGVMGAGLAKQFHDRYPGLFVCYDQACGNGRLRQRGLYLWKPEDFGVNWVLCFPTKNHWTEQSDLRLIERGLEVFRQGYQKSGITSIAFPALGCGLGGLKWEVVEPLMMEHLDLPIEVEIYLPA